ncbi:tRNA (N6-threonylcarbamoyladenosine(37)-N6)-methyltransferase TrmO [Selenomonas sp. F0473]|uniref:tRNA (N6-threonylcarbamoyladenosine(37)-N6)-methyltransferase TrmO n=1 Tax=Selenomonas sp. F0473 TaxID=999423 RepID=UPI00029E210A|nr:tRNA (N6-threonylcarbamoyladenosine(37)-N6)-methyltransferase TrmO [Selenomonas sp. F0473]EKU71260.1 hypothetical protein HMPREF9161_00966 [Selenomonas sp. F0473]
MELQKIGTVRSPYKSLADIPRQGRFVNTVSEIEILPAFADGLLRIETAQRLIVLYWANLAKRDVLQTLPPAGSELRGVFSCRAPHRPNPISLCIADLLAREGNILRVKHLDALDGSAVIDIKPYTSVDSLPIDNAEEFNAGVGIASAKKSCS